MTEILTGFTAYIRFASCDPDQNRFRFYDLRWQPTLFGEGALVRVWGRQGQPGTTRATVYADRAQAARHIRQVVRRRLAHGYQVRDWQ
jgi:predicted DNA-binding WGR domain protein